MGFKAIARELEISAMYFAGPGTLCSIVSHKLASKI